MKKLLVLIGIASMFLYGCADTRLIVRAKEGNIPEVSKLLNEGVDVNEVDDDWVTAIERATYEGHTEIVKMLLAKGARVNERHSNGWTILMTAAQKGYTAIVRILLDKGADINAKDEEGYTVLMAAASGGKFEIFKMLLDKGVDINTKDKKGYTVLIAAADGGNPEIVKKLLDMGLDVNLKTKQGLTALMGAAAGGHTETVKILLAKGADVNAEAVSDALVSYRRMEKENMDNNEGANMKKTAPKSKSTGWTALRMAIGHHHLEVAKLLLPYERSNSAILIPIPIGGDPVFLSSIDGRDQVSFLGSSVDILPHEISAGQHKLVVKYQDGYKEAEVNFEFVARESGYYVVRHDPDELDNERLSVWLEYIGQSDDKFTIVQTIGK